MKVVRELEQMGYTFATDGDELRATCAGDLAAQDAVKADIAELKKTLRGDAYWTKRSELTTQFRQLALRASSLADSIGRQRERAADLETEAEVLAAVGRPSTPALVALRDALD